MKTPLSEKLGNLFNRTPKIKELADSIGVTLEGAGVESKESGDITSPDSTVTEPIMDAKVKEEEKKEVPAEEKKEEEKKGDEAEKKEVAPDPVALLTQIQESFAAATKEQQTQWEAQVKELNEFKQLTEQGFVNVKGLFDAQAAQMKELGDKLAASEAKVKELSGEIPNAVRSNAYHPSQNLHNIISGLANQPVATAIKEAQTIQQQQIQNPSQQTASGPINDFLNRANQGIGLAPASPQNLPQ